MGRLETYSAHWGRYKDCCAPQVRSAPGLKAVSLSQPRPKLSPPDLLHTCKSKRVSAEYKIHGTVKSLHIPYLQTYVKQYTRRWLTRPCTSDLANRLRALRNSVSGVPYEITRGSQSPAFAAAFLLNKPSGEVLVELAKTLQLVLSRICDRTRHESALLKGVTGRLR